jgi:hypothetical protein
MGKGMGRVDEGWLVMAGIRNWFISSLCFGDIR